MSEASSSQGMGLNPTGGGLSGDRSGLPGFAACPAGRVSRRGWLARCGEVATGVCGAWVGGWPLEGRAAGVPAGARAEDLSVMATYLLHFVAFTSWPAAAFATATESFRVGIAGVDPFGSRVDDVLKGERVRERGFVVRRSRTGEGLGDCHILFLGDGDDEWTRRILASVAGRPVLTLGARVGFCEAGGMVLFRNERGKLTLEINRSAVARAGLTIDSRLLNVAKIFRERDAR